MLRGCGEMADALALGASVFDVGVQVPSSAPENSCDFVSKSQLFSIKFKLVGISEIIGLRHI